MKLLFFNLGLIAGQFSLGSFDLSSIQPDGTVDLRLNQGTLEGYRYDSFGLEVYRGVPYAEYQGRWEYATLTSRFTPRTFEAHSPPRQCAQPATPGFTNPNLGMDESCLTLDIYRPAGDSKGEILFWIHGGGFLNGDSTVYSGIHQAVTYGNTVVVIQYRLGIFGFMTYYNVETALNEGGNYGLHDQLLALQFIFENKDNLGCNRITVNGESAGAASVSLLLLNDLAVNMIDGAVAQSGNTLIGFIGFSSGERNSPKVNQRVDALCNGFTTCDTPNADGGTKTTSEKVAALKSVDLNELMALNARYFFGWEPIARDGTFFETDALEKFRNGNLQTKIPLVTGTNSYEGSLVHSIAAALSGKDTILDTINKFIYFEATYKLYTELDDTLNTPYDVYYTTMLARYQAEKLYLNLGDEHYRFLSTQMVGDVLFKYGALLDATKYAEAGADVYLYHFDVDGRGDSFINGTSCCGLGHAKELVYSFGGTNSSDVMLGMSAGLNAIPEPWEVKLEDSIGVQLSNFVKTGLPDGNIPKFTKTDEQYIKVTNNDTDIIVDLLEDNLLTPYRIQKSDYAVDYWKSLGSNSFKQISLCTFFTLLAISF